MNCHTALAWCLQLEVRDLSRDNSVCFKGAVGSTVNNALHIAAHSSGESQRRCSCIACQVCNHMMLPADGCCR